MDLRRIMKIVDKIRFDVHDIKELQIKKCLCGKYADVIIIDVWIDKNFNTHQYIKFICNNCNYRRKKEADINTCRVDTVVE